MEPIFCFVVVIGIILAAIISKLSKSKEPTREWTGGGYGRQPISHSCPYCRNGYVREWEGQFRCWNCVHVFTAHELSQIEGMGGAPPKDAPGDVREVRYFNRKGEPKSVLVDFDTLQIVGNTVTLARAAAAGIVTLNRSRIINPEVLGLAEPEPPPPVLEEEEEPPILKPQLPEGTRVLIRRVPTDSYEAVQVMRHLMPQLNTFEIFELLEPERLAALTGYDHDEAIRVGGKLEAVGCTVSIKREES